jgi:hypothetical protein
VEGGRIGADLPPEVMVPRVSENWGPFPIKDVSDLSSEGLSGEWFVQERNPTIEHPAVHDHLLHAALEPAF